MEEATKTMKETKTVNFMDHGYSLDSITKHEDDQVVVVSGPTRKEPNTMLLTQ